MPVNLVLTADTVTAISARAVIGSGAPAGSAAIQLQLACRKDFEWCVSPIFEIPTASANYVMNGLNQSQSYFLRGRYRYNDGTVDDWTALVAFRTPQANAQVTIPAAVMIDPAIIMFPESIIGWTAGNEVAGYPAKNVSRDAPVAWRSLNAGNAHWITLQHAGAPIDTIAVLMTNLPEAATATIRVGATAAAAAGAAASLNAVSFRASPNVPGRPGYHGLFTLAAPVAQPFIRIELNGATPGGLLEAQHVLVGLNRKSKNHALDMGETPLHLGSLSRGLTGNPDRQRGLKMRRVDFDLAWLTEAQHETLYQDLYRWIDEAVFVVPNSKANFALHDRLLYGDLKGGKVTVPSSPHRTRSFSVESLI